MTKENAGLEYRLKRIDKAKNCIFEEKAWWFDEQKAQKNMYYFEHTMNYFEHSLFFISVVTSYFRYIIR